MKPIKFLLLVNLVLGIALALSVCWWITSARRRGHKVYKTEIDINSSEERIRSDYQTPPHVRPLEIEHRTITPPRKDSFLPDRPKGAGI